MGASRAGFSVGFGKPDERGPECVSDDLLGIDAIAIGRIRSAFHVKTIRNAILDEQHLLVRPLLLVRQLLR